MRSNYKRIGDYIKQLKVKNTEGKYNLLLGINIDKHYMPSVANIVGVDLKKYKVVKQNQFACNRMHVGRDYRIPIALSDQETPFIVSPAYTVFEIKDTSKLLPEYLMMWFSRPEFDREAWFHTDADVRGGLPWELFCDIEVPIPSIEKQREIVTEYNTITNRIALNEQLNQKLEETAQTLYKHWFVDFDFPNEQGKPYKSSGGEMVWCDELDKEIPVGWELSTTDENTEILFGYSFDSNKFSNNSDLTPLVRIRDIINNRAETFTSEIADSKYLIDKKDLLIGMDGTFHTSLWMGESSYLNQRVARIREFNQIAIYRIYFSVIEEILELEDSIFGTTVSHLSNGNVRDLKLLIPNSGIDLKYGDITGVILNNQVLLSIENRKLEDLRNLVLAKMTKIKDDNRVII